MGSTTHSGATEAAARAEPRATALVSTSLRLSCATASTVTLCVLRKTSLHQAHRPSLTTVVDAMMHMFSRPTSSRRGAPSSSFTADCITCAAAITITNAHATTPMLSSLLRPAG